jgi:hypothetical protein
MPRTRRQIDRSQLTRFGSTKYRFPTLRRSRNRGKGLLIQCCQPGRRQMGQSSSQRWSCASVLFVCVGIMVLLIRVSSETSAQGLNCRTDSFGTTRCDNGQTFRTDSFGTTRDNYGNSWRTDSFGTTRGSDGSTYRTDSFGTTRDNSGNSWRTDSFGTTRGSNGTICRTDSFGTTRCY